MMHAWQMIAHAASAAVDLRLGVRESLWLAGFLLSVSSAHPFKVICVCALVRQSLFVCVSFWSRCICVALPGLEFRSTHARPLPSPRSISQSIKCLSVSLCSLPGNNRLCVYKLSMSIIRGETTLTPVSHSPSFGEAFPTAISPRRPALSLLRALQQCPSPALAHVPLWSWSCHFPCFPPLASSAWCCCCCYYCYCAVISCMSDCTRDKCQMSCPD